jgi:hypothetical protein
MHFNVASPLTTGEHNSSIGLQQDAEGEQRTHADAYKGQEVLGPRLSA